MELASTYIRTSNILSRSMNKHTLEHMLHVIGLLEGNVYPIRPLLDLPPCRLKLKFSFSSCQKIQQQAKQIMLIQPL